MDLQSVTLHGFRRFAKPTELRTNGKLVVLLGPNEAGKTTILNAISTIGVANPISKSDLSRGAQIPPDQVVISARFRLNDEDLAAANISQPTWYILDKKASGKQTHRFDPPVPRRNTSQRKKIVSVLEKIRSNNRLWGRLANEESIISDTFGRVIDILKSN